MAQSLNPPLSPENVGSEKTWLGWTMVSVATLSYSIAAPIVRWAILDGMNPTTLLMVRMVLTTSLLGGSLAIFAPSKLKIDKRGFWTAILAGTVNGTGFLTFFWSLKRIDASVSAMLFSLAPLVILGMLALRGEKLTYRHLVRLALGLAGVYFLIGPGGDVDLTGALLVGLGIITFSFQLVMLQWYLKDYDGRTITFYILSAITVDVIVWWLIEGKEWHDPGVGGWMAIFTLAIVCTFLARLAMFASVRYIGSGQTALFMPLETLLTVVWSILFLNEHLNPLQWLGGGLILTSVILAVQRLQLTKARFRWRRSTRI